MKSRKHRLIIAGIGALLVGFVFIASTIAERGTTREYEVTVPAVKSDTQRMIEAYERLSDQYLSLVQNQLNGMTANNRDILVRLDRIEKKLDELSAKVVAMKPAEVAPPAASAKPVEPAASAETKKTD
jgi:TolA-binding protein